MSACRVISMQPRRRSRRPPPDPATAAIRYAADLLWPAWRSLDHWEPIVVDELGGGLARLLLLLWMAQRVSGTGAPLLADDLMADGDPLLLDALQTAFTVGAAWAEQRPRESPASR